MYADTNYKSKKQFKLAVDSGQQVRIFAPGPGSPRTDGPETVEGPWYPEPHKWYAQVEMRNGVVVKVK